MPECLSCHQNFKDWAELALHISTSKSNHRKGKKWAAGVLLNVKKLNKKKDAPQRIALTEQEKENKADCKEELSGRESVVVTICPSCKQKSSQSIPTEYVESNTVWKSRGLLVINCFNCRK
jgi:hypothetical protein